MSPSTIPTKNPIFTYHSPLKSPWIGLVSIPHSGEDVPPEFLPFLTTDPRAMKEDVDYKVNELVNITDLQKAGIGVLEAHVHRVCVDLNRAEENCVLFWKENTKGVQLVTRDPGPEEVQAFIERYHRPFFEVYASLLRELEKLHEGKVPVIDLHSMPSAPTAYHMKQNPHQKTHRADFCVSDQRGKTATPEFINWFADDLRHRQFETAVNDPYIGGYVTTFVDKFRTNNIQIEINRRIYMDEEAKVLNSALVPGLKANLTQSLINGVGAFQTSRNK